MTRIHTITHDQAKQWYDSGRKYKPLGTKLTNNIWLNYDAANDRYTLAYTHSKYYEVMNAQGEKQYKRAGASERDKYTQEFIGFVYRDHAHIFHPDRLPISSRVARSFFESHFNCTYRKAPGVKVKGFEWTSFREGLSYWQKTHGAGEVELSGAGLRIYPDGRHEATEPVMVRVHKKEQQNAMNRHTKAVRRMLTLRAKLGGFNSVDWAAKNAEFKKTYGGIGWQVLSKPSQVNDMFMAIDDEDYTTMLPVLWLAAYCNTSYYWREPQWDKISASYNWADAFNRLVNSVREDLRNEQGAVEYVPDQQTQQGSEGTVGSEETSAGSSAAGEPQLRGV